MKYIYIIASYIASYMEYIAGAEESSEIPPDPDCIPIHIHIVCMPHSTMQIIE